MRKQRFLLLRRARPLLCHEWKKFPSMNHHLSVGAHEAAYSLPLAAGISMASFMHNATLGSFGSLGVQDASLTVTCMGVFVEQYYVCVRVERIKKRTCEESDSTVPSSGMYVPR